MNKELVFYNKKLDKAVNLPLSWDGFTAKVLETEKISEIGLTEAVDFAAIEKMIAVDTFTISFQEEGVVPMTYNQWETLRSLQANAVLQARIADLDVDAATKEKLAQLFNEFNKGMAVKYEYKKSWLAIYEELLANLLPLL
ncbi:hypothetical protein [Enterococcus nangangensis]|uniref:hypothetical protein n=1 Tax=Enterococcus nangangensis TaxID=2559926 RepID=UPI0010F619E6|nr:hypothetical protein [Enterococcus nangangensis]